MHQVLIRTPFFALVYMVSIIVYEPSRISNVVFFFSCGLLMNLLFKLTGTLFLPPDLTQRPFTCPRVSDRNASCEQCGMLPTFGKPLHGVDALGMPSGHVQFLVMIYVYLILSCKRPPAAIHLMAAVIAAVGLQRISSGCHSSIQVAAGGAVGCVLGYLAHLKLGELRR